MEMHESCNKVEALEQEVLEKCGIDTARVLECCAEIEEYARKTDDVRLLGFAYYYRGANYYMLNDSQNMSLNIAKAIGYLDQSGQWELVGRSYNLLAIMSVNKGNPSLAVDYYLTGLNYCARYGVNKVESMIEMNLGYLYLENKVFREAQHYFGRAYQNYMNTPEDKRRITSLIMIYSNLATCYIQRGNPEGAREYLEKLDGECRPYFKNMDYIYVGCMKTKYYQLSGETALRDACIDDIRQRLSDKVLILDLFDDLYDFGGLMLDIGREDVLLELLDQLEETVEQTGIANLQRKLLSLKIRYYDKHHKEAEFLQASGRYYHLSEKIEMDNRSMVANMLYVRNSLECANEKRKKLEEVTLELVKKSETDPLTNLANRYRLSDYSEKVLEDCLANGRPLSFEILDIDYFKQYNDNYGHQAGDECVKAVAGLLRKMENDRIFCARYGGDEFIIIYNGMSAEEVLERAEKLRQDVMGLKIEHQYSKVHPTVTISQGICHSIPKHGNKNWDFLHAADTLLYQVKKKNRNSLCIGDINGQEFKADFT